jgi:carbonic anhydrase/acetyltransferase-like protein (isoleucine patch superfamily)
MKYNVTPNCSPIILPYKDKSPRIADDAFIAPGAAIIGDVEIGSGSSIWFGCVLRGDEHRIRVGERVNLQDGTVVHVHSRKQGAYIGNDVTVGHMVLLHACTLEDGAYVGMGAQILDEAVVESGAMLAAGALLTPKKRVPAGELWAGRPASFMRRIPPEEREALARTAVNYAGRAVLYQERLSALRG